jgi:hypothetical protein
MNEPADRPASRNRRWPVFFLLVPAAVSVFLHATKFLRSRECAQLSRKYQRLPVEKPIASTKARRALHYQIGYFLAYPAAASYAAADLVRRMDDIAPPLQLLAVQVDPGLHDLSFELTVGIAHAGPRSARRQFAAFLQRLGSVPGVFQAEPSPVPPARGESGLRVFVASGRAELQP